MIITVTLNPALDKTARVNDLRVNALNRLHDTVTDAGGKGVNVSTMIRALGGDSIAVGFAGGGAGNELLMRIAERGISHDFVAIKSTTRTNLKVIDDNGSLTELNESGPEIHPEEMQLLEEKLLRHGVKGNIFALSGSLPRGLNTDTYTRICAVLRERGASVFLDADGDSLALALEAENAAVPNFIKPNSYELLNYFGMGDRNDISESILIQLCVKLLDRGVELVSLSMGPEGALFVTGEGIWKSPAVPVTVRSSVGAGDSMVGALVYGFEKGLPYEQCFALAMASSAGACTTEGTKPPDRGLVDELVKQVKLQKIS
jgi:1-phosphofructokinase